MRGYYVRCLGEVDGGLGIKPEECPIREESDLYGEWLIGYEKVGGRLRKSRGGRQKSNGEVNGLC